MPKTEKEEKEKGRKIEKISFLFYFLLCTSSFILTIFFAETLFFYFFLFITIFSSIMILWLGKVKVQRSAEIEKKHGKLLKLIYWLGFFCFILYFYKLYFWQFFARYKVASKAASIITERIAYFLLLAGLGAMFLSILVANMLYKKAMFLYLKKKQKEREKKEGEEKKEEGMKKEEKKKEGEGKKEEKLETQIDELLELLQKNKRLGLSFIIKKFGLDRETAIKWCNVLTEHGLAEMHYPPFGEPELRKKAEK